MVNMLRLDSPKKARIRIELHTIKVRNFAAKSDL